MTGDDGRRGVALLEVLAAMTILGLVGSALVRYVGESAHAARRAAAREDEIVRASSALSRLTLLRKTELLARTGRSHLDGFVVRIDRVSDTVFFVSVLDADGRTELLSTHLEPRATDVVDAP